MLLMIVLALVALGINGWLLVWHIAGGGVTGCGGGGCDDAIASPWAVVLGVIPVPLCGVLAWSFLLGCALWRRWIIVFVSAGVLVGAAIWFVFVQAALLGKFCPWCMTAHGIALIVWILSAVVVRIDQRELPWGLVLAGAASAIMLLGIGQMLGPPPRGYRTGEATVNPAPVHERGSGPKARFADGRKIFDMEAMPRLGPASASCVVIEYFDYTCAACRTMHGFLETLRLRHPEKICVLVMPVPLEHQCNPALPQEEKDHEDACAIARIALAVWRIRPNAFPLYHEWLMEGRGMTAIAARAHALRIVSEDELALGLADPWVNEMLAANVSDWKRVAGGVMKLPKLMFSNTRIIHGLPSSEADFIHVMERELGLL